MPGKGPLRSQGPGGLRLRLRGLPSLLFGSPGRHPASLFGETASTGLLGWLQGLYAASLDPKTPAREAHAREPLSTLVEERLSLVDTQSMYYLATELRFAFGGVRIALPPENWEQVAEQSPADLATTLVSVAGSVHVEQFTKTTRGPKKAKRYAPAKEVRRHIATARARAAGTVDYGGG